MNAELNAKEDFFGELFSCSKEGKELRKAIRLIQNYEMKKQVTTDTSYYMCVYQETEYQYGSVVTIVSNGSTCVTDVYEFKANELLALSKVAADIISQRKEED